MCQSFPPVSSEWGRLRRDKSIRNAEWVVENLACSMLCISLFFPWSVRPVWGRAAFFISWGGQIPVSEECLPHWASRTSFILTVFWGGEQLFLWRKFNKRGGGGEKVMLRVLPTCLLNKEKRQEGCLSPSDHLKSSLGINRRRAVSDMWNAPLRHPAQDCLSFSIFCYERQ